MTKQEIERRQTEEAALDVITGVHSFYNLINRYEKHKRLSFFLTNKFISAANDLIERWEAEESEEMLDYLLEQMEDLIKELKKELK